MNALYAIISVILVSLLSIIAATPLLIKKKIPHHKLLFLLSISVGVLLATVFLDFFPEIIEQGYSLTSVLFILAGFLIMFALEKLVHWHHNKKCEGGHCHGHAYNLAPLNLVGDGVHNFIDGLVIAGAYSANIMLGVTATISIIFHEIPQEIADFGVLLYSGMTKKRALMFNFLSATTAILGAIIGLVLIKYIDTFTGFIVPFAAGNFLYIASANLVPQLHRHCTIKDTLWHLVAVIIGIGIIVLVTVYSPGHLH